MDKTYYKYLNDVITEMMAREMTVSMIRSLFDSVYYVAFYQKTFLGSKNPETEALARWSLGDARDHLDHLIVRFEFDFELAEKVRYLARSPLSCDSY